MTTSKNSYLAMIPYNFLFQAAMCYIHIAALIAEYLKRKGKITYIQRVSLMYKTINYEHRLQMTYFFMMSFMFFCSYPLSFFDSRMFAVNMMTSKTLRAKASC